MQCSPALYRDGQPPHQEIWAVITPGASACRSTVVTRSMPTVPPPGGLSLSAPTGPLGSGRTVYRSGAPELDPAHRHCGW